MREHVTLSKFVQTILPADTFVMYYSRILEEEEARTARGRLWKVHIGLAPGWEARAPFRGVSREEALASETRLWPPREAPLPAGGDL